MTFQFHYLVNSGLCWLIVVMAWAGYFLTWKRTGQKWPFWVILSVGWTFLAVSNSLSALNIGEGTSYLFAIWLSSYVLVFASLVLLFVKLIDQIRARQIKVKE
jgi:hypothetical protein